MVTARERFEFVARKWFICEPALFAVYCTHDLVVNNNLSCVLRSGAGRVEYNEESVNLLSDPDFEQRLRTEMLRICLRHPYERQPTNCCQKALHMGSDMVLAPVYDLPLMSLAHPKDFQLPVGQHFEWYADTLNDMMRSTVSAAGGDDDSQAASSDKESGRSEDRDDKRPTDSASQGKNPSEEDCEQGEDESHKGKGEDVGESPSDTQAGKGEGSGKDVEEPRSKDEGPISSSFDSKEDEYAGLWREDEEMLESLKETLQSVSHWGTIPHNMVEVIQKALEGRIDYRKVLRAFQTSVISTNRSLTRMRPNRRFGFDAMGSKHDLSSRLLVAVDVSGSVSSKALGKFFRIITNFFKYGVEAIDVIQFDAVVGDEVMDLKAGSKEISKKEFKVCGRGGTSFQCVVDYLKEHNHYDGLIIFTDGYAPAPTVDFNSRAKFLWVTETEDQYKAGCGWMRQTGRSCFIH